MNLLINMGVVIERELELERQGYPRTRRYIGDDPRVTDSRWYRRKATQVTGFGHDLDEGSQGATHKPRWVASPSILARLFRLPRARPEKECQEYSAPKAVRS